MSSKGGHASSRDRSFSPSFGHIFEVAPTTETVVVSRGSTTEAFGGAILISLAATVFDASSQTYTVIATVGALGYRSTQIDRKRVGLSLQFTTSKRFDIKLVAVDTFTGTFRVTLLKEGGAAQQ